MNRILIKGINIKTNHQPDLLRSCNLFASSAKKLIRNKTPIDAKGAATVEAKKRKNIYSINGCWYLLRKI